MNYARELRCELSALAQKYAEAGGLPYCLSYGDAPVVCFVPHADQSRHGNFLPTSFRTIVSSPAWRKRLAKIHPHGRRTLPSSDHGRWRELDSCISSDALLMNIFCNPGVLRSKGICAMLGLETRTVPRFGCRARVPLANGHQDRTEVDMQLGNLLVEAKLTETDFQRAEKRLATSYRDLNEVFEVDQLPQVESQYLSYQLIRNVLAAHAQQSSFCVLLDARRPDLIEEWYAVMRSVRSTELRTRLQVLTWQELALVLPKTLQTFLGIKYGIDAGDCGHRSH
jgi:hypothetical protein